jgi:hypothetical protein
MTIRPVAAPFVASTFFGSAAPHPLGSGGNAKQAITGHSPLLPDSGVILDTRPV